MVPVDDLQVLAKALEVSGQDHDRQKGSTRIMTPTQLGQRSVLNNMKFGPENRPNLGTKEGRVQSRYPDLLHTDSI